MEKVNEIDGYVLEAVVPATSIVVAMSGVERMRDARVFVNGVMTGMELIAQMEAQQKRLGVGELALVIDRCIEESLSEMEEM